MGNLVSNGNFDTLAFLPEWTGTGAIIDTNPSNNIFIDIIPNGGYNNLSYASMGNNSHVGKLYILQTISTVPGTKYTLSYYLLNQGGSGYQYFAASLDNGNTIVPGSLVYTPDTSSSSGFDWTLFSFDFVATSSTVLKFTFQNNPAEFWLTNISIALYQPKPTPLGLVSLIPAQTSGPASIPTKQNQPNNQTNVAMGMPFKPDTMTQGSVFSLGRMAYNRGVVQNVDAVCCPD